MSFFFYRSMEECPVCFETVSKKQIIRLECLHTLCFSCGHRWLTEHMSCPLCRHSSLYFCRSTRSLKKSVETVQNFLVMSEVCAVFLSRGNYTQQKEIEVCGDLLTGFVVDNKELWYRPHLLPILRHIYESTVHIMGLPTYEHCSDDTHNAFETFRKTFSFARTQT